MNTSTQTPEEGQIPQSEALAEADFQTSLAELMSRDPEGFSAQDRGRIIQALRADRARREKAEQDAAASGKKPRSAAAPKGPVELPPSAASLGL